MKLFNIFRASLLWSKTLDLGSKGQHEEALKRLAEIEKLGVWSHENDLLGAVLANRTGRHKMAIDLLAKVSQSIQRDKRLKEPIKQYLLCFAEFCTNDSEKILNTKTYVNATNNRISYDSISLKETPRYIKPNFPLINHPDWPRHGNQ